MKIHPNNTTKSENSFDKICKGQIFSSVEIKDSFKSSESEGSKENKFLHVTFKPRPLTRKKKKRIPEFQSSFFKNEALSKTNVSDKIPADSAAEKCTKSAGTSVFDSLSVEVVNQKCNFSSLTFLKSSKSQNEITSSEPFFSETFIEKQAVHSSTPCVAAATEQKIVADPISPITKTDNYGTPKAKCDNRTGRSLSKTIYDFKGFTENTITVSSCKLPVIIGSIETISVAEVQKKKSIDGAESSSDCDVRTAQSLTKKLSDFNRFTKETIVESVCQLPGIIGLFEKISATEVEKNKSVDDIELSGFQVSLQKSTSVDISSEQNREEFDKSSFSNECVALDNSIRSIRDSNEVDCISINSTISSRKELLGETEKTEVNASILIPTVDLSDTLLAVTTNDSSYVLKDLTNDSRRISSDAIEEVNKWRKTVIEVKDSEIQLVTVELYPTNCQRKSNSSDIESSIIEDDDFVEVPLEPKYKDFDRKTIKPGKLYRRSLSQMKRTTALLLNICSSDCECINPKFLRPSVQIVPLLENEPEKLNSVLKMYARTSYLPESSMIDLEGTIKTYFPHQDIFKVPTARDIVLQKCGQVESLVFSDCYSTEVLQNAKKIGEGVYSEVFLLQPENVVLKVIPIEGSQIINGERQKEFKEILSEIVIATELTKLRTCESNFTRSFSEVKKISCVKGRYPDKMLKLWNTYHEIKGSENDSPAMFKEDQLYIVLEFANAGEDLETFLFNNAIQTYSMFRQTACALAVAEAQLKFEHRDLHWGNVLVNTVERNKKISFTLCDEKIEFVAKGIEVTIIDFTMSRIENDSVVIFIDLSKDEDLFLAEGDYQFDVYRMMRDKNGDEWQHYEPYSNILWLHYLLDKMISAVNYKNAKSKIHKAHLKKLRAFKKNILSFSSVAEFVKTKFICK